MVGQHDVVSDLDATRIWRPERKAGIGATDFLPVLRRIAIQRDLDGAEFILAQEAHRLTGASRIYVHYVDEGNDCLWTLDVPELDVRVSGPSVVAFAARTGQPVRLERISLHPYYSPDHDDPHGFGLEPALIVPAVRDGSVFCVITAIREQGAGRFKRSDERALVALARHAAAILGRYIMRLI